MIEEKTEPLRNLVEQIQLQNMNVCKNLEKLEQNRRRSLIRLFCILVSNSEDIKAKILEDTSKAGTKLSPNEVINPHRVGKQ